MLCAIFKTSKILYIMWLVVNFDKVQVQFRVTLPPLAFLLQSLSFPQALKHSPPPWKHQKTVRQRSFLYVITIIINSCSQYHHICPNMSHVTFVTSTIMGEELLIYYIVINCCHRHFHQEF